MGKEEELGYLKDQAEAIKDDLERIEARVHELEGEE
jgi:ubiquinone biosynthesis protein UbiJ